MNIMATVRGSSFIGKKWLFYALSTTYTSLVRSLTYNEDYVCFIVQIMADAPLHGKEETPVYSCLVSQTTGRATSQVGLLLICNQLKLKLKKKDSALSVEDSESEASERRWSCSLVGCRLSQKDRIRFLESRRPTSAKFLFFGSGCKVHPIPAK